MNSNKIETLGINKFTDYIALCDLLDAPNIVQRDKLPIWDGEIYLYDSEEQTKESQRGVIKVQIKSTANYESNSKAKYPIATTDLRAYLNVGGTAFFVIHVNGTQRELFYKPLDAVSITNILEAAKDQKTKIIELSPVPEDKSVFEREMFDLYNNIKAQISFQGKFVSISEWNEKTPFVINAYGKSGNALDALCLFTAKARQLYIQQKGFGNTYNIPVKEGPFNCSFSTKVDVGVYVNGTKYYDSFTLHVSKGIVTRKIGHCLLYEEKELLSDNSVKQVQLKYEIVNNAETLDDAIEDLRFLLAVDKYKCFSVGDWKYGFDITMNNRTSHEKKLKQLEGIKFVFDTMHVTKKLILKEIKPGESNTIDAVVSCILYGNSIFIEEVPAQSGKINIGNITLYVDVKKVEGNKYMVSDYFACSEPRNIRLLNGDEIKSSPFLPLYKNDFLEISNINYGIIVESFEKCLGCDPNAFTHAHKFFVEMLKAYDSMEMKNPTMLKSCKELAKWLLDNDKEENLIEIHQIDLLQVTKRERSLNEQELEIVYNMLDSQSDNLFKFVCYVLLDDLNSANRYYKQLDSETQNNLKNYPIYYFMEKTGNA